MHLEIQRQHIIDRPLKKINTTCVQNIFLKNCLKFFIDHLNWSYTQTYIQLPHKTYQHGSYYNFGTLLQVYLFDHNFSGLHIPSREKSKRTS